ncbi:MAG: DUF2764 family protein [Actinobacteria bacterium]|nr:DUF2764 family protein [Actinomycetota bacterium]
MPRQYPYIVSSLPLLQFGGEPPMTADEFVDYCDGLLQPADLATLRTVIAGRLDEVREPAVHRFAQRDIQLRNAVARQRAGRVGVEPGRHPRHDGWDVEIEDTATQAMSIIDPLERQLVLDRLRWRWLEEMAAMPAFGVQAIHSFALRLRMLEKWQRLTDERGTAVAERIIDSNIAEISV